jgi:hypothetical protein
LGFGCGDVQHLSDGMMGLRRDARKKQISAAPAVAQQARTAWHATHCRHWCEVSACWALQIGSFL